MNRDELRESLDRKARLLGDLHRRTDPTTGRLMPEVETDDDRQRRALQRGLDLSAANGDRDAVAVFAEGRVRHDVAAS